MILGGVLVAAGLLVAAALLWLRRDRRYQSSESVAEAYDAWTDDRLLERLWGEHVHLGHYGNPPGARFRRAKEAFVHELVRWSGLDQLPAGSTCSMSAAESGARILARDYGFDVLGISIGPAQVQRATDSTDGLTCRFAVMDALALDCPDRSFDAVWSVERDHTCPTSNAMPMVLRVLRPGDVSPLRIGTDAIPAMAR